MQEYIIATGYDYSIMGLCEQCSHVRQKRTSARPNGVQAPLFFYSLHLAPATTKYFFKQKTKEQHFFQ